MILADKIITLRKKNGWSQEELAEKLNVTRQSVSKWEGAQSVPDLSKILLLSQIFEVSTDFLLKDELEEQDVMPEYRDQPLEVFEESETVRRVSMEEARAFLDIKARFAARTALATALCILSPICLIILGSAQEAGKLAISENMAAGAGIVVLLLMIAAAVAIFMYCEIKTEQYSYLEKNRIETEYGVIGMVKEEKSRFQGTYITCNIIGTCFCILAVTPLFAVVAFTEDDFLLSLSVGVLLFLVAVGVFVFVLAGVRWESMQKLLQEGDFTAVKKKSEAAFEPVAKSYWLIVTAMYLGYSFVTHAWEISWIIWPVAGVLFAALKVIYTSAAKRRK